MNTHTTAYEYLTLAAGAGAGAAGSCPNGRQAITYAADGQPIIVVTVISGEPAYPYLARRQNVRGDWHGAHTMNEAAAKAEAAA